MSGACEELIMYKTIPPVVILVSLFLTITIFNEVTAYIAVFSILWNIITSFLNTYWRFDKW